jgi:hypothetical protein
MTVMVRKQIYLEKRQATILQQQAKESGMTEADLIRRAIDRQVSTRRHSNATAWKKERAYIQALIAQGPVPGRRKWSREDLYDRW